MADVSVASASIAELKPQELSSSPEVAEFKAPLQPTPEQRQLLQQRRAAQQQAVAQRRRIYSECVGSDAQQSEAGSSAIRPPAKRRRHSVSAATCAADAPAAGNPSPAPPARRQRCRSGVSQCSTLADLDDEMMDSEDESNGADWSGDRRRSSCDLASLAAAADAMGDMDVCDDEDGDKGSMMGRFYAAKRAGDRETARLQHKANEQKRRNEIRDAFEALKVHLPMAPNVNSSKAEVLLHALAYIRQLQARDAENETINSQLSAEVAELGALL